MLDGYKVDVGPYDQMITTSDRRPKTKDQFL